MMVLHVKRLAVAVGLAVGVGYLAPMLNAPSLWDIAIAVLLGLCAAAGLSGWRSGGRWGMLFALPACMAALCVAWSVPLAKNGYPEVSITATGQKNPQSKASEVFVRLVSDPVQGKRDFDGKGWEKRDELFVSFERQPSVLHYRGAWSPGAVLRLVRHPYSGIAEVSIGNQKQRIDLYAAKESYVDLPLPLPEATVAWTGYLQRAAIAAGLGLFFAAIAMALARKSVMGAGLFALALLAGAGTLWLVKDRTYVGLMEVVAFDAASEPVRVEMDAGHGFTSALVVPVKTGTAVATEFGVEDPAEWKLGIEGGSLRALRDLDAMDASDPAADLDHGCPIKPVGDCVYEVQGTESLRVWLQAGDRQKALTLPAVAQGRERLFLRVERGQGRVAVAASRAYLQLSPWENFSRWIVALRVVDQDGKAAGRLLRISTDGNAGFTRAQAVGAHGAYAVPPLARPATGSSIGMKFLAVWVSVSFVLLLAAAGKIALELARSWRAGRRVQVLAAVLGCLGWLGLGTVMGWPGVMGWDGLSPYIQAQTGQITLWYGIGYPMIVGGFLLLGPGALITVWSVLATACLLLGAAALLLRRGSAAASWLAPVLLCAVLPFTAIVIGTLTHLRDAMNGLMLAAFAFCGFYVALQWQRWSCLLRNGALAGLLLGGALLALLRIDNIPTLLVLAAGLVLSVRGFRARALALVAVAAVCWVGVGPLVERFVLPDREGAASEKRLYASTAIINPLTGVLVLGRDRVPEALYTEIHSTLDKVVDVEHAVQHWSPYHIIYWHQTIGKREVPSVETNAQLRNLYLLAWKSDPMLLMKLRLATFGALLGHEWFEPENYQKANGSGRPSFHDHLLATAPGWQLLTELFGFAAQAHPFPAQTQALLDWEAKLASTVPQILICLIVALRFRRHPLAAVVALGELVRAGVFFLLAPASVFFYLYDMHLLGFLLPMMALTEQAVRTHGWNQEEVA